MKHLLLLLSAVYLSGCFPRDISRNERDYLRSLISTPSEFVVHKSQMEECRGKAQTWLARYTKMKPQIITEYIIVTYNGVAEGDYSYVVTLEPRGDSALIAVSCRGGGDWDTDILMEDIIDEMGGIEKEPWDNPTHSLRNEKMLANYLITGKNPFPDLIEW